MSDRRDTTSEHGESPEILVGIMHSTREPWISIVRDGQLPAWEKSKYQNFSVIYFFGRERQITSFIGSLIEKYRWRRFPYTRHLVQFLLWIAFKPWSRFVPSAVLADESQSNLRASGLKVNFPDITATMRWKKLAFLEYFLNQTKCEYLIISNSSSILNFEPIVQFLEKFKAEDGTFLYAGLMNRYHKLSWRAGRGAKYRKTHTYVSGSFTVLNRPSASLLLEGRGIYPVHSNDDLGMGRVFEKLGIQPIPMTSLSFESFDTLQAVSKEELRRVGHFRLKSGPLISRNDIEIMHELTKKLYL